MRFIELQGGSLRTRECFTGYVSSNGVGDMLPAGWTVSRLLGFHVVTHGLGTTAYTVLTQIVASTKDGATVWPAAYDSTSFSVANTTAKNATPEGFFFWLTLM